MITVIYSSLETQHQPFTMQFPCLLAAQGFCDDWRERTGGTATIA